MSTLPQILPADPGAPEHMTQPMKRLRYGPLARTVLGLERLASKPIAWPGASFIAR